MAAVHIHNLGVRDDLAGGCERILGDAREASCKGPTGWMAARAYVETSLLTDA